MAIYYLIMLGIIITFTLSLDNAYGGIEIGDGVIEINELTINPGSGFEDGETITITQQGATAATGTFTNLGEIQPGELSVFEGSFDHADGISLILEDESGNEATATFDDKNGNTKVEAGEVVNIESVLMANGNINISGALSGGIIAIATFVDSESDVIGDGELTITNGGAGFTDGTVTLTGQTSGASTTAQFTDTNIACSVPVSDDWTDF